MFAGTILTIQSIDADESPTITYSITGSRGCTGFTGTVNPFTLMPNTF